MKLVFSKVLVIFFVCQVNSFKFNKQIFNFFKLSDSDEYINTTTLIKSKGYIAEEHEVITDDGYHLLMHRIPSSRHRESYFESKQVVFLQHGLLDASSTWAINFPDQSLAFVLADSGFDVWLGNMRGNTYGRKHSILNPSQQEFWDFSWDEMAQYDLPSMINYVLKTTDQKDLFYIGHSQGTLIGFSGFGNNLNLASKIKLFIGLGPVATVKHLKSPFHYLADIGATTNQEVWYTLFGKKDFLPSNVVVEWLADKLCNIETADKLICENIIFALCGPSKFLNQTRVSVYTTHTPAGTSVKNLAHFAQMVISGKFQMYDYGCPKKNMLHYNQTTAPIYDLSKIKIPVALYWSENDWLAGGLDVDYLKSNLPNIIDDINLSDWDHLDFVWGTNAKSYLYDRMIDLMKKFI